MNQIKQIVVKVIPAKIANDFIKKYHYSKKVVSNSSLHFGCFLMNRLHGVISYGSSLNKKGTMLLVEGTRWNEFIEINRMAFDECLPRNSESRCIAITLRLLKKNAPHIKWVISFADATQCGDGTIYRACGFKLVGISENTSLRVNPRNGVIMHQVQAHHLKMREEFKTWQVLPGKQLKYVYLLDSSCKLTAPVLPYSRITELDIGMYRGKKITRGGSIGES